MEDVATRTTMGTREPAERELWRSADPLRTFAEGTADACYVKNVEGRYLWCNRAAAQFMGLDSKDIVGKDDTAIFPAEQAEILRGRDREVVASRKTTTYTVVLETPDGRRTFHIKKGPLVDEAGTVAGIFGVARDVTQEREAEATLQKHEARFQALVQHSSDVTTILDPAGAFQYASPSFYRLFGFTEPEILGHNAFGFIHEADRPAVIAHFADLTQHRQVPSSVSFRFRKADGSYLVMEAVGTNCLDDPHVNGVVVNSRDVTERNRLGEQLRHAQKMEALGRLAGGVAHDFNNLLTVITANSGELLRYHAFLDEAREMLGEIRTAGERAAQLTRRLLAFGRRQAFEPKVVDLNELLTGLAGMLRRVIGEDVRLDLRLSDTPGLVRVDPGELEQVVMNLSINARDAMPNGGILSIETRTSAGAPVVALMVSDTGCGMDPDTKARMFEPFFTTKGPGQGTGLGLATVYGIVSHSNATIEVDSAPGSGTSIAIDFPSAQAEAPAPAAAPAAREAGRGSETILIVEDEDLVRQLTRRVLATRGYRVLDASSAEDALARFGNPAEPVDLMLTDVVMPGMNGRALADQMTRLRPGLRVLFMSGYADVPSLRDQAWTGGVLVQKPFDPDSLERLVRQTLDGPEPSASARVA